MVSMELVIDRKEIGIPEHANPSLISSFRRDGLPISAIVACISQSEEENTNIVGIHLSYL